MAASTPTVPSVAGDDDMKMGSFNVTPAGPLDAAYALSPVSTGAFASSESSPSKRFWEARARAWTSGEEESTTGAFGSVAPSTKTAAGAEDTSRGAGVLSRRVEHDQVSTPREVTVIDAETILGVVASAAARATKATNAGVDYADDAATHDGDRGEKADTKLDTRTPLRATARALDFDPNLEIQIATHDDLMNVSSAHNRKLQSSTHAHLNDKNQSNDQRRARDALLAFLERKTYVLRERRATREVFMRWRDVNVEMRADKTSQTSAVQTVYNLSPSRTLGLAFRTWHLVMSGDKAKREACALHQRLADIAVARALAEASISDVKETRDFSNAYADVDSDSGNANSKHTTNSSKSVQRYSKTHPLYGQMDDSLARWLGVDRTPGLPQEYSSKLDDEVSSIMGGLSPSKPRAMENTSTVGKHHSMKTSTVSTLHARGRLDAMEALMEETREATNRSRILESQNETLESDLYAAAVVWEETERENRLLTEQLQAMRLDAERMREDADRLHQQLKEAEEHAVEAAHMATATRVERTSKMTERGERENSTYPRNRDSFDREPIVGYSKSAVGDEVEELEACAAALRMAMSTRRHGDRRGEDQWRREEWERDAWRRGR